MEVWLFNKARIQSKRKYLAEMIEKPIPTRPDNDADFKLTKAEKDMLLVKRLLGYSNQAAFALFNPHLTESGGKLNKTGSAMCRQFFSHPKNVEWLESYEITLRKTMNVASSTNSDSDIAEIEESRKDKALKSLLNQAMSLVEGGDSLDPDTLKVLTEIFKRLGILKDEVEEQEAPRRYLPVHCSECLYRSFVEDCIQHNEVENTCLRCKALVIAKEHGFRYNPTSLLQADDDID